MKKILTIAAIVIVNAGLAGVVLAADGPEGATEITSIDDILKIMNNVVAVIYRAFFIVAIGVVILAAFNYLMGGDDPEKIKSATKQIMWASVAIVIALISVGANVIIKSFIE